MKILLAIVVGLLTVFGLAILMAFPVMWLWDWLMPTIFNLPEVTIWQALGLNVLSAFLIKGTSGKS